MAATVTARFTDPAAARKATLALERHGVEANRIHVRTTPSPATNRSTATADVGVGTEAGKRAIGGGVLGALVLAAVSVVVVLVLQPEQLGLALVIAAMGGAIVGSILGGIWSSYSKMPVSEAAYDTFKDDAGDTTVVVSADDLGAADEIRSVVEPLHPADLSVDGSGR